MFDIGWSELLILGIITLLFVGPKELPVFLRTIGRFTSVVRKQAAEFRAQFDEAMRDTELDQIRKDVAGLRDEVSSTVRQAKSSVESELAEATREADIVAKSAQTPALPKAGSTEAASAVQTETVDAPQKAPEAVAEPVPVAVPAGTPVPTQQEEKSRL
ncbi:Sec-independent protein translocase protein TatB [Filomicrobium sp.]|uniref:Sec-independent protein translocase protein TatB n=1 Tax=Filomicrobium sp. TaxID=2024831 RepID=UPI0025834D7D|nr:Sec-independent protein translocase protein TatB [Filomicrobium sp.]MCV0369707.1 Sec-independent protein translocase protein TatB [Filomicrobium sp.]